MKIKTSYYIMVFGVFCALLRGAGIGPGAELGGCEGRAIHELRDVSRLLLRESEFGESVTQAGHTISGIRSPRIGSRISNQACAFCKLMKKTTGSPFSYRAFEVNASGHMCARIGTVQDEAIDPRPLLDWKI